MSGGEGDSTKMKRMVDLLRSGAAMLADVCPLCSSPLFRLRSGDVYCPGCSKRVIFVKEGEDASKLSQLQAISELSSTVSQKIMELTTMAKHESDSERLYELGRCILTWLEVFERVKRFRE
ncbi:MAG: Sjogren's syndrome/scleroderma autoantigen 1 family protein [Candidatus Nezhaarchaeota archaeon]|nr:Sjogren's syndrome/scleroderma autoantigen 1 family protein [Candidatus Nezhaarchaeota archaeon]